MPPVSLWMRILALFRHNAYVAVALGVAVISHSDNVYSAELKLPNNPFNYTVDLPAHLKNIPTPQNDVANTSDVATLGRVLFYDKSLSKNNLVSCASCHSQANGFDDPKKRSIGFKGIVTDRSSMGLTNARFNANGRYFWDERAQSLKEQVLQPFFDPIEMGQKEGGLVRAVKAKDYYPELFAKAFGAGSVSKEKIATALAVFVTAIVSVDSKYDRARGLANNQTQDFEGFSSLENVGKTLFFSSPENGGAGCASCHQGEAMISPAGGVNNGLDKDTFNDAGVGKISKIETDDGKFRPPSLRNISVRAPYMHDGRFKNLEQVIEHYSVGIKNHPNLGEGLKDETGRAKFFNFSSTDKAALIAFLETLSDETLLADPKFSNPFE